MDRIAKALAAHDEVYAEINDVLFGGGADELISKLSAEEKKFQRRQAQVGLASNVVGLAAGVAGTKEAYGHFKAVKKIPTDGIHVPKPMKITRGTKALAAGALGLQAANIAGDAVANRVLARGAKKEPKKDTKVGKGLIVKSSPDAADLHVPGRPSKLKAVQAAQKHAQPVLKKGKDQFVLKLKSDGVAKRDEMDVVWEGEFSKVDEDKRQVFGFATVTKIDGEDVIDKQGDYISTEEVEKAAYDYVHKSRKGGDMHRRDGELPLHVSDMIESVVFTDEKIEKMGLPDDFTRGWWVGFQINDEDTWQDVKSGKRTAFSVHGRGSRVERVPA